MNNSLEIIKYWLGASWTIDFIAFDRWQFCGFVHTWGLLTHLSASIFRGVKGWHLPLAIKLASPTKIPSPLCASNVASCSAEAPPRPTVMGRGPAAQRGPGDPARGSNFQMPCGYLLAQSDLSLQGLFRDFLRRCWAGSDKWNEGARLPRSSVGKLHTEPCRTLAIGKWYPASRICTGTKLRKWDIHC